MRKILKDEDSAVRTRNENTLNIIEQIWKSHRRIEGVAHI